MNDQIPTPEEFLDTARWPGDDDDYDDLLRQRDERQHEVGESVTGGGIDFTKLGELPFGPGMLHVIPPDPMERVASALEQLVDLTRGSTSQAGSRTVSYDDVTVTEPVDFAAAEERFQNCVEALHDETSKRQTLTQVIADVEEALGKSKAAPALAAKAVIEAWRNPQVPEISEEDAAAEAIDAAYAEIPAEHLPGHTRKEIDQADGSTPSICQECSYAAQDYVNWPCTEVRLAFDPIGTEAGLVDTGLDHALETYPPGGLPVEQQTVPEQPDHGAPVEEWRAYARSLGFAGPEIDNANRSQIRTALGVAQPVQPAGPA